MLEHNNLKVDYTKLFGFDVYPVKLYILKNLF